MKMKINKVTSYSILSVFSLYYVLKIYDLFINLPDSFYGEAYIVLRILSYITVLIITLVIIVLSIVKKNSDSNYLVQAIFLISVFEVLTSIVGQLLLALFVSFIDGYLQGMLQFILSGINIISFIFILVCYMYIVFYLINLKNLKHMMHNVFRIIFITNLINLIIILTFVFYIEYMIAIFLSILIGLSSAFLSFKKSDYTYKNKYRIFLIILTISALLMTFVTSSLLFSFYFFNLLLKNFINITIIGFILLFQNNNVLTHIKNSVAKKSNRDIIEDLFK